jgi:hypothetical protein
MRAFFGLLFGNIRHQLPKYAAIPIVSFGKGEIHNDDMQGVEQSATGRTQLSKARPE